MDYFREMLNMSGTIMKEVSDAIDRGDYSNLSSTLRRQMQGFTDGMKGNMGDTTGAVTDLLILILEQGQRTRADRAQGPI